MVVIKTPKCLVCGEVSNVELTDAQAAALATGELIQLALHDVDADTRELIMTGTHPACWDLAFEGATDEE